MAVEYKTLTDWLEYIEAIHPESIEFGLERVGHVFRKLFPEGLPFPVITVAGTNGKGTCCAYIESILQKSGLAVGKYTSPHLVMFNERVMVDALMIDDDSLVAAFQSIECAREEIILTYFEYTTLAAMLVFADKEIEFGVFEVGLGGRLDAVNILDPIVSVITSIGIDHVDWLGDDREKIGLEKAAIARSGKPCVIGELDVPGSVELYLQEIGALCSYIGDELTIIRNADNWEISANGKSLTNSIPLLQHATDHQYRNAACAVMAVIKADIAVSFNAIHQGVADVAVDGRCQLLSQAPWVVLDVAHNEDSVLALREYISKLPFKGRCHAVFSMLRDKDVSACVEIMFDLVDDWNIAALDSVRANSVEEIESIIEAVALHRNQPCSINSDASIQDAFIRVKNGVNSDDCIIVFGSFLVVGDILLLN